ncbi:hypothetical protein [Tautonia marina]|uniref:hypothetical protein n=1 Tax=Tautonia marina TaxID=2653855 RepID=UPI001260A31E|nr:hypothetical protein [Tautonia marina]
MAASLKQTLANRLNALRSTGPKSTEGKTRSSRNAQTHGLSRVGLHPPAAMAEAIAERQSLWRTDYHPTGSAQEWHFDRLVAESVRLDLCEARICASRAERATRASESWDDDQAAAIAQRAATLSQRPEIIQPVLLQTKHGVLWLLERWDEILESLQRLDGWTPETWNLALDLLGVPTSARDASGPWDLHPDDSSAAPGLDLVAQSTAALRDRLDTFLNARDDRARTDACLGLDADDPPALRLLERYAADARRRFSFFLNGLRRLQSEAPALTSASPPAGPPSPRPVRSALPPEPSPTPAAFDRSQPSPPPAAAGRLPMPSQPSPPIAGERVAEGRVRGSDHLDAPVNPAPTPAPASNSAPSAAPTAPSTRLPGGSLASTVRDRLDARALSLNRRARRARAASARRS